MGEELASFGLKLTRFLISNISLPPELEKMLDKRIGMGMIGNDMGKFTQYQAANAMEAAASNPGGGASEGIGLGAGLAMGQAMASAMTGATAAPAAAAAPAAPAGDDLVARLGKLKGLLDAGLISQDDFDTKKASILAEL
jgi:membrane protease subunit (stomatin/prohibitin family)